MSFREIAGLFLICAGAVAVPMGWIFSHGMLLVALGLLMAGFGLFYTERVQQRWYQAEREGSEGGNRGPGRPGDVHNYTGWQTGGRTEPLDSFSDSSDGGSD